MNLKHYLLILFCLLFLVNNLFAQDFSLPIFNQEKSIGIHFGFGEEYSTLTDRTTLEENDVRQKMTLLGINWEHDINFGYYRILFGYNFWGNTINDDNIETYWKHNEDWGLYFVVGYSYLASVNLGSEENITSTQAFFGGGFNLTFNGASMTYIKGSDTYETTYSDSFFSINGTGGVKIPDIGLTINILLKLNFLLSWEEREVKTKSDGKVKVTYLSEKQDLSVPIFGGEFSVIYQMPTEPRIRFALCIQFINVLYFIIQVGYNFDN